MKDKYKIIKKAYKIDFDKIDEGYIASDKVCHADSIGKAKSLLLRQIKYDDWKMRYTDELVTYTNIPVKRYPEGDLVDFEGEPIPLWKVDGILRDRTRKKLLDDILIGETKYYHIKKNGMYYKPNSVGYTDFQHMAGIYPKEDAVDHARHCDDIYLIPINIDDHNMLINLHILELQSRIITE